MQKPKRKSFIGSLVPLESAGMSVKSEKEQASIDLIKTINKINSKPLNSTNSVTFSYYADKFNAGADFGSGNIITAFESDQSGFFRVPTFEQAKINNVRSLIFNMQSIVELQEAGGNPNVPTGDYTADVYYNLLLINDPAYNNFSLDYDYLIMKKCGELNWDNTEGTYTYDPLPFETDLYQTMVYREFLDSIGFPDFSNTNNYNLNNKITRSQYTKIETGNYTMLGQSFGVNLDSLSGSNLNHTVYDLDNNGLITGTCSCNFIISGNLASYQPLTPLN